MKLTNKTLEAYSSWLLGIVRSTSWYLCKKYDILVQKCEKSNEESVTPSSPQQEPPNDDSLAEPTPTIVQSRANQCDDKNQTEYKDKEEHLENIKSVLPEKIRQNCMLLVILPVSWDDKGQIIVKRGYILSGTNHSIHKCQTHLHPRATAISMLILQKMRHIWSSHRILKLWPDQIFERCDVMMIRVNL